ncbi:MAG: hypothetical protein JNJ59_25475 [Deltaproteobacteria bacterium]|jgi:uncharacterized protein (TIGR03382 family)|nr:hypothetical protein [Deltaproteobacteria bacterium]
MKWCALIVGSLLPFIGRKAAATYIPSQPPALSTCFCGFFALRAKSIDYAAIGPLEYVYPSIIRFTADETFGASAPLPGFVVDMRSIDIFIHGRGPRAIVFFNSKGHYYIQAFEETIGFVGDAEEAANGYPRSEYCDHELPVANLMSFLADRQFDPLACETDIYENFDLPLPPWLMPKPDDSGCSATHAGPMLGALGLTLLAISRRRRGGSVRADRQ